MSQNYNDDPFANPGEPKRGQCVLYRNVWFKPSDFPVDEIVDELFAVSVNQAALEEICARAECKSLRIKGLTATDLSPISALSALQSLDITLAHKFTDASPLQQLQRLKSLSITDTKRWHDLSQIENLKIEELDVSGGLFNTDSFETLAPLAKLRRLKRLTLNNIKVIEGGLKSLSGCTHLEELFVDYTLPTEDYAYLSVKMPHTKCDAFAPYVYINTGGGKDVLVVGFRKPFLNSKKDAARLEKYSAQFAALQQAFIEG